MPDGMTRHVMQGENRIAGETFEQAVLEHFPRTTQTFFSRLENHLQRAFECPGLRQVPGRCQQGCRMPIVATGMHDPVVATGVGQSCGFLNRQGIHVRPQADGPALTIFQGADHARLAHTGADLESPLAQAAGHQFAGSKLLKTQFGMRVNLVTQRNHFIL
ncbi:hypothetical protein D3C75_1078090 [compost metagenome]